MSKDKQLVIWSSSQNDAIYRQMAMANLMVLLRSVLTFMIPVDIREICLAFRIKYPDDYTLNPLVDYLKSITILETARAYKYKDIAKNRLFTYLYTRISIIDALYENLGVDNAKGLLRNLDCFPYMPEALRLLIPHLFLMPHIVKCITWIEYDEDTCEITIDIEEDPLLASHEDNIDMLMRTGTYTHNTINNKRMHITREIYVLFNDTPESSFMLFTGEQTLIGKMINDI